MEEINAKDYLKLGTSLRYLIDVEGGEPLGGKHVLQEISTVLALVDRLGFTSTAEEAGVKQLKELKAELNHAHATAATISTEHAERLERICRKIRDALFMEGKGMLLDAGNNASITQPLERPEKVTFAWLFKHVPVPMFIAFFGLLFGSYSLGVKSSENSTVREVFGLDEPPQIECADEEKSET